MKGTPRPGNLLRPPGPAETDHGGESPCAGSITNIALGPKRSQLPANRFRLTTTRMYGMHEPSQGWLIGSSWLVGN